VFALWLHLAQTGIAPVFALWLHLAQTGIAPVFALWLHLAQTGIAPVFALWRRKGKMAIYEYECLSCKHKFEILQSITAKPKTKCPKCGKKLKKLISSAAGFIFKGAGFYATDYKKSGKPQNSSSPGSCLKTNPGCAGCPGHK
jgi:putative FmdB family regulatory protein